MNYSDFLEMVNLSKMDLYRKAFNANKNRIRVKKEETVVKNLEKIFCAALKLSNRIGFQAMSMRDLSREADLSMGALYAYFSSKEELGTMLQRQGSALVHQVLEERLKTVDHPVRKLKTAVLSHLYLSEALQPWFYFTHMESAKGTVPDDPYMETLLRDILFSDESEGMFGLLRHRLGPGLILALLRDWYLNRKRFRSREVSVDQYADYVMSFLDAACKNGLPNGHSCFSENA